MLLRPFLRPAAAAMEAFVGELLTDVPPPPPGRAAIVTANRPGRVSAKTNVLLGANQGLAWSLTVVMKIDLAGPARPGAALRWG
jgi:hypothetical protein